MSAGAWLCRLGLHRVDESCRCTRCGATSHRRRVTREWRDTDEIDATWEPWVLITEEHEVTTCRRCGAVLAERPTGNRGWRHY